MKISDGQFSPANAGSRRGIAFCATIAAAVLVPLSINAITGNALTSTGLMNADALWSIVLLQDLFAGGHLADWNLAQHADIFPDKLFGAIAYAVSDKPETWLFVFEALNLALCFGIAWYCLSLYLRATAYKGPVSIIAIWPALVVTALPPFLRSWGILDNYFRFIGWPAHHFGPYFCAILASFIAIDCFGRPLSGATLGRLTFACALMLLVALSDKLTVLIAIPGLLVAAAYIGAISRSLSPALLTCCASFCAVAALGFLASDPLWNHFAQITPAVPNFDPTRLKRQVGLLLESLFVSRPPVDELQSVGVLLPQWHDWYGLGNFLRNLDPARATASGLAIAVAIGLALAYLRRAATALARRGHVDSSRISADAFVVYLIASAFLLPAGLIAAGVLYSYGVELYVYPAAYCILWAAVARLSDCIPTSLPPSRLSFGIAATGLTLSAVPIDFAAPPFLPAPDPPLAKCLEAFGKTRILRLGLASHWETYPIEFATHGRIIIRAITGDARIYHWIDNYEWYAPRADGRPFTFVIPSIYVDTAALRDRVGDPTEILDCASLGPGFSNRKIQYYEGSAAERLTARITEQYRRSERR